MIDRVVESLLDAAVPHSRGLVFAEFPLAWRFVQFGLEAVLNIRQQIRLIVFDGQQVMAATSANLGGNLRPLD